MNPRCSMKTNKNLIPILRTRFENNMDRHPYMSWNDVEARILRNGKCLAALQWMEDTGGQPDVIWKNPVGGEYCFCDCSPETPAGRTGLNYDSEGALELAAEYGLCLLLESEYMTLQHTGEYDRNTSSWIATPMAIRNEQEALYCERRFGKVFVSHCRYDNKDAKRGFRTIIYI